MKIELIRDIPIDPKCGAVEGAIFDVIDEDPKGRGSLVYFIGDDGQKCAAYSYEYKVISKENNNGK